MTTLDRPDAHIRVGDAERAATVERLAEHHAAGRLTIEEFEDRVTAAWSARTHAELAPLEADLPPLARSRPGVSRQVSTQDRIGRYAHVVTYVAVVTMLWLIWLFTGMGHPWPIYPMFGWGAGVVGHLAGVGMCNGGLTTGCDIKRPHTELRL